MWSGHGASATCSGKLRCQHVQPSHVGGHVSDVTEPGVGSAVSGSWMVWQHWAALWQQDVHISTALSFWNEARMALSLLCTSDGSCTMSTIPLPRILQRTFMLDAVGCCPPGQPMNGKKNNKRNGSQMKPATLWVYISTACNLNDQLAR